MKAAIYARFSNEALQDARSVDDQVSVCRDRADREGWTVVDVFTDCGISGAVRNRPGLEAMLGRCREFDILISEAVDRVSRHQADSATIYDTLKFNDCRWITLSEGEVTPLVIGFKGTMAATFLTDLADKIRRGQKGRVAAGRIPGGICYGYRKVVRLDAKGEPERGLREIDPEQAAIVLRVYEERAAGLSAHQIVQRLNAEAIPSPNGGQWSVSMVSGDGPRGSGILRNRIYIGELTYNRTRMVRDPVSRRRVWRANPVDQWTRHDMPELRIVPQPLWERVQAAIAARGGWSFHQQRRPRRLLSGLVECGLCGGNYVVVGADLWGCATQRQKRACDNGRKITTAQLEGRVLEGLQKRLLDPELVRLFIKRFHTYNAKAEAAQSAGRIRLERRLEVVRVKVDRLVTAFANGGGEFDEIREVMLAAKAERASIEAELAELDACKVVPFMPNIADEYQRQVARLGEALAGSDDARLGAVPALRSLIESIRLYPKLDGRGVDIEVTGRLASIIAIASGKPLEPERLVVNSPMLKAVAEERFPLHHRITRIIL